MLSSIAARPLVPITSVRAETPSWATPEVFHQQLLAYEDYEVSARVVPGTIVAPTARMTDRPASEEGRIMVSCAEAVELSKQVGVRIHWRPNGSKDKAEVLA